MSLIQLSENPEFPGVKRSAQNININLNGTNVTVSFQETLEGNKGTILTGGQINVGNNIYVPGVEVSQEEKETKDAKAAKFMADILPIIAEYVK